jgi:hypothetical protein
MEETLLMDQGLFFLSLDILSDIFCNVRHFCSGLTGLLLGALLSSS